MGITKIRKDLVAFAEYNLYQLIVPFWFERMVDEENGGYHAEIDSLGKVHDEEERGVVTSARILWTASAIYNFNKEKRYLEYAERAFDYLV
jgi:mannobiose 2-epimerase